MNQKVTFPEFDNTFLLLKRVSYLAYRMVEGDAEPEDLYGILKKLEFVDENFEWIYDEADDV